VTLKYEELTSRRADGLSITYTDTDALLYNLSVGMGRDPFDQQEFPYFYEKPKLRVVPTAASVLGSGRANLLDDVGIDWTGVVHGEQRMTFYRPLPPQAELISNSYISEVVDKGAEKGALITTTVEASLPGGERVCSSDNVIFARRNGGFGGPTEGRHTPHVLPDRAPDMVHESVTRRDQALLYRLNGDRHDLHVDPEFARAAGFPKPILHGLCTYGIACRAILASVCDYDPARIAQFDVRFSAPVFPGETILTEIWVDGETVSFRCRVADRDAVVLNNGKCLLRPA